MTARPRVAGAVARLRGSDRARWWTTFLLAAAIGCCWLLATPLFGSPDEPAHAIRAASVARGQILGDERDGDDAPLVVDAPASFGRAGSSIACFVFARWIPASCASFEGSGHLVPTATSAGRHPPFYYAMAGIPTLAFPSALGVYLMRLISVLVTAAFVATTVVTLQRTASPALAGVGLLASITPMVWFVSGSVNPSAPEIAAAIALWVTGAVLVSEAATAIEPRLVTRVGVAAAVLVLARQLAPLWLGLIALALVAIAPRDALVALWRSRRARVWAAVVGACTLVQLAWIAIVKPLDSSLSSAEAIPGLTTRVAVETSFGEAFNRFKEQIGWFGWLDSPPPAATVVLWTALLGGLALLAVALAPRRYLLVGLGVAAITVAAPVVFETREAETAGFFWQGRYGLPFAVGVPIVLALGVAAGGRWRGLAVGRLVAVAGTTVVAAQVLAFAQALRRNAVGYDGRLGFVFETDWAPPVPNVVVTLALVITVGAFAWWVLDGVVGDRTAQAPSGSPR